jgi:hypothetical protein
VRELDNVAATLLILRATGLLERRSRSVVSASLPG